MDIAPRFILQGSTTRVTQSVTAATESSPAKPCARVVVLTDGGGFVEVYFDDEQIAHLPKQGERVLYSVDVRVWNRGTANGSRFGVLSARLAEVHDVAGSLHAVA
jgi:hypothetical protein